MAEQQIIIRKSEDHDDHDHHGGAWKVAYADFMTAMMAFFLLLWIVSAADEKKLKGLAEFFTPTETSSLMGGEGFLEGQVFGPDGIFRGVEGESYQINPPSPGREIPVAPPDEFLGEMDPVRVGDDSFLFASDGVYLTELAAMTANSGERNELSEALPEQADSSGSVEERSEKLEAVEAAIDAAVTQNSALDEYQVSLRVEQTPEGLLVQILDQDAAPMFELGSARIGGATRDLLQVVGQAVADLPYPMIITGHTDAVPFATRTNYGNWELSADRANAARRVLVAAGVSDNRIARVSGVADTMPLNSENPTAPENRRLTILLIYPDQPDEEFGSGGASQSVSR